MLIRNAKYNQFDVFLGKGWKFWGRFLVKKSQAGQRDSLIKLKGSPFTREEIEEVEMSLCANNV